MKSCMECLSSLLSPFKRNHSIARITQTQKKTYAYIAMDNILKEMKIGLQILRACASDAQYRPPADSCNANGRQKS